MFLLESILRRHSIQLDFTELRSETGTENMRLFERNPPTCPPLNDTTIGRILLPGGPPLREFLTHRCELEEMPFVNLRLGRPHVVSLDTQRANDVSTETGLLEHLPHDGDLGSFPILDSPGRHLDACDLDRDVVMREHEQFSIPHHVADDFSNETALGTSTHGCSRSMRLVPNSRSSSSEFAESVMNLSSMTPIPTS